METQLLFGIAIDFTILCPTILLYILYTAFLCGYKSLENRGLIPFNALEMYALMVLTHIQ